MKTSIKIFPVGTDKISTEKRMENDVNNAYLELAKKKIENPRILVNLAAKRASELAKRYRPLVQVPAEEDHNYLNIALLEIAEGALSASYCETYK